MKTQTLSRFARRIAAAAAIVSLAAGAGLVAAAPAHAATSFAAEHTGYYQLMNVATGKVLDINNFDISPGGKAIQWGAAAGNKNQHWFFRDAGSGYTEIVNRNSGLVLAVDGGSNAPGTRAIQWNATGALDQRWALSFAGGDSYKILNAQSAHALSVSGRGDGAAAIQAPNSGTVLDQLWEPVKIADADFAGSSYTNGDYTIRSAHTGFVLDVSENSKARGTKLIQWASHGGANQQWSFRTLYGKTQIFNRSSGLLAAVSGASLAGGASVIQWGNDHVADQRWIVEPVPGKANTYTITNDNSGKRLSVSRLGQGDTPYDIIQSAPTGGTEQQWVITRAG